MGKKDITPYWRVIREDGGLIEKFLVGTRAQARRLRQEGHAIKLGNAKGAPKVKDFEKCLVEL